VEEERKVEMCVCVYQGKDHEMMCVCVCVCLCTYLGPFPPLSFFSAVSRRVAVSPWERLISSVRAWIMVVQ
jgi:hypothetical protein